jgi:hypothetical protein
MESSRVTDRRRRLALSALVLLAVGGLLTSTILAVFTDTATSTGNTFSSGGVDIAAAPATAAVTLTDMVPGSRVTAPIDVSNSGSLELRYAVESTTDEDTFAGLLRLRVKTGVGTCDSAGFDGGGTLIAGPGPVGTMTGLALIGDAAQGQDPDDRVLVAGGSEQLCVDVELPSTVDNSAAGSSTTATFTFLAEQTVANP